MKTNVKVPRSCRKLTMIHAVNNATGTNAYNMKPGTPPGIGNRTRASSFPNSAGSQRLPATVTTAAATAATITNTTVNSATKGSSSTRRRRKVIHTVTVVSPATPTRSESAAA